MVGCKGENDVGEERVKVDGGNLVNLRPSRQGMSLSDGKNHFTADSPFLARLAEDAGLTFNSGTLLCSRDVCRSSDTSFDYIRLFSSPRNMGQGNVHSSMIWIGP